MKKLLSILFCLCTIGILAQNQDIRRGSGSGNSVSVATNTFDSNFTLISGTNVHLATNIVATNVLINSVGYNNNIYVSNSFKFLSVTNGSTNELLAHYGVDVSPITNGVDGSILKLTNGTPTWTPISVTYSSWVFGDGSDGDVTISSNTTLTNDMYYRNLTIATNITLYPNGFRIFVQSNLVNNGTISTRGTNGDNATGTTGGNFTYGPLTGNIGGGGVGKNAPGASGPFNGNPGNATDAIYMDGGLGGYGGNGGSGPSGAGAAGGTNVNGVIKKIRNPLFNDQYAIINQVTNVIYSTIFGGQGGASGGGGTGDGSSSQGGAGGGGGSGAGNQTICARSIVNNFSITANGGNGGNGGGATGTNAGGGGGGAGGGGGIIYTFYFSFSGTAPTITGGVGGSGGTKLGSGTNGTVGGNGANGKWVRFNCQTDQFE